MTKKVLYTLSFFVFFFLGGMEHDTVKLLCLDGDIEIPSEVAQQFESIRHLQEDMPEETTFPLPGVSKEHLEEIVACMPHGKVNREYCLKLPVQKWYGLDQACAYLGAPGELECLKIDRIYQAVTEKGYPSYFLNYGIKNNCKLPFEQCISLTQAAITRKLKESMKPFLFSYQITKKSNESALFGLLDVGRQKIFTAYHRNPWHLCGPWKQVIDYSFSVRSLDINTLEGTNTCSSFKHIEVIKAVADDRVAIADHRISIADIEKKEVLAIFSETDEGNVEVLAWNDQNLISGSYYGAITIWDVARQGIMSKFSFGGWQEMYTKTEIDRFLRQFFNGLAARDTLIIAGAYGMPTTLWDMRFQSFVKQLEHKGAASMTLDDTVIVVSDGYQGEPGFPSRLHVYDKRNWKRLYVTPHPHSPYYGDKYYRGFNTYAGIGLENDVLFYGEQQDIFAWNLKNDMHIKLIQAPESPFLFAVKNNSFFIASSNSLLRVDPKKNVSWQEAFDKLSLRQTLLLNAIACEKSKKKEKFFLSKPAKELYESIDPTLQAKFLE